MKREILFKAKRIEDGKWTDGFYVRGSKKHYLVIQMTDLGMTFSFIDTKEIDPDTLCQFTGLLDKNGKKIFEGDIFKHDENDEQVFIAFRNCAFFIVGLEDDLIIEPLDYHVEWLEVENKKIEIIGNIHDSEVK